MLFTIIVRVGAKGYAAQHNCDDWNQIVPILLASPPFREFCRSELAIPVTHPLSANEVFLFVPMEPLVEVWLAQGGRDGKYFEAICVRTAEADDARDDTPPSPSQTSRALR